MGCEVVEGLSHMLRGVGLLDSQSVLGVEVS